MTILRCFFTDNTCTAMITWKSAIVTIAIYDIPEINEDPAEWIPALSLNMLRVLRKSSHVNATLEDKNLSETPSFMYICMFAKLI
jgi:hypothetical protein